jgi:hypothetical protein
VNESKPQSYAVTATFVIQASEGSDAGMTYIAWCDQLEKLAERLGGEVVLSRLERA